MHKHYSNEHSSAEVVVPTTLPKSLEGVLELVRVWTDPEYREQGFATELMQSIIHDADVEGVVLMLQPRAFGAKGLEDLQPWYARFGFTVIQRSPVVLMARMPAVYKTKFSAIGAAVNEATNG